jgi:hypothetical protein
MKRVIAVLLGFLLLSPTLSIFGQGQQVVNGSPVEFFSCGSIRNHTVDAVVVSDVDPYLSLLSTSIACWYDKNANTSGLLPLLVNHQGNLTDAQVRLLQIVLNSTDKRLLVLGESLESPFQSIEFVGEAPSVASQVATMVFSTAPTVLIVPYGTIEAYRLSLLAAPLASYLNMPFLIFDDNQEMLQDVCVQLQTTQAFVVGDMTLSLPNVTLISLSNEETITDLLLTVITDQFGSLRYLTMTNPADVIPPQVTNTTILLDSSHIINRKLIIFGKELNLAGNDTNVYEFFVPDGLQRIQISAEVIPKSAQLGGFSLFDPLIFLTLTDASGDVLAYGNSMGYDIGKTSVETLSCNASGWDRLQLKMYHGIKGGYFIQRGVSWVDLDYTLRVTLSTLSSPHLPFIPNLSCLAPYLTAAHGGVILANTSWELTDDAYASAAQGTGSGPWYTESLHPFTNAKVNRTVQEEQTMLERLNAHDLLTSYLDGPAWLVILADTTMIPMYYYSPSQQDIPDRGLPSDNPYTLNQSLSVGRLIGWDVQDVSVLIARTFFYEQICGEPTSPDEWQNRFHFFFGEGYSETGGLFHQIPYAKEIRTYGFTSKVYGDFRNSRQIAEFFDLFTSANYLEYLGHGDWFWFPASLYGLDSYSKAFDVAHVKDWVFDKPSIFLSAACLMGRTDGLSPRMNIGLAFLHAGCNAFIGATRETGQESGLTTLENHLIVDDWSIGEALRGEKQIDTELPTFYVRVLYADPAFNPYEPQHGFSTQGRPVLLVP